MAGTAAENGRVHTDQDVVIVGAGPTGLLLAGDLAERGVSCTVLERHTEPANTATTRAFAVHARTLEQLDARGLADRLIATGSTVDSLRLYGQAAIPFTGLPSRFAYLLVTPQYNVEHLLEERALAAGARIVRGARVTRLSQDGDSATVHVEFAKGGEATPEDGAAQYQGKYVIGADGVHSAVRNAIGVPYTGRAVVRSIMLADVRFAQPPADVLAVRGVGEAFAFIAPFGDGWHRVFCWNRRHQVPSDAPLELAEIRKVLLKTFGTDFGLIETRWLSRFQSDERQAPTYRVGRVFLAGDAAHCHSPAGGQGMNTGIQDAANLGWKLAAALRGMASDPERLLDSYQAERHPVGRQVLRSSGAIIRLALLKPLVARVARDGFTSLVLRLPGVVDHAMGSVSGIGIEYGRARGEHPSVGRRAADIALGGEAGRLYEQLRDGHFVVIAKAASADESARGNAPQDTRVVDGWNGEVDFVTSEQAPAALTLVRPDGYIAWASDEGHADVRASAAHKALAAWLGERRNAGDVTLTTPSYGERA